MLRMALRLKVARKSENSSSSGSESSDGSMSETSYTRSQGSAGASSETYAGSQPSLGNKTKSEKSEHEMNSPAVPTPTA